MELHFLSKELKCAFNQKANEAMPVEYTDPINQLFSALEMIESNAFYHLEWLYKDKMKTSHLKLKERLLLLRSTTHTSPFSFHCVQLDSWKVY